MSAIVTALISQFLPYIIAGGAAIIGLGLALWKARQSGVKSEQAKQLASEAKARSTADEIDDAIAGRTADENRKRLSKWSAR